MWRVVALVLTLTSAGIAWEGGSQTPLTDAAVNIGSLRTLGTGALQAAPGNDSRLSDSRAPTAHAQSHRPAQSDTLSDTYTVTTRSVLAGYGLTGGGDFSTNRTLYVDSSVLTPTWGNVQGKPSTFAPIIGSGAGDAVAGNDSRLTDSRAPTAHAPSHHPAGSDPLDATYTVTTRSVLAGYGLTGGGDFSTNRTLYVDSSVLTPTWANLQSKLATAPITHDVTYGTSLSYDVGGFAVDTGKITLTANVVRTNVVQTMTNKTLNDTSNHVDADAIHRKVRNQTGSTLTKGQIVYVNGWDVGGSCVTVALARSDSASTMPGCGLVEADIINTAYGEVRMNGILIGLDTSEFSAAQTLYISSVSAGVLTGTRPTGVAIVQNIARVGRSHASQGTVNILPNGPHIAPNFTAGNLFWFSGTDGTLTEAAITATGRSIIDDASVSAVRSTLEFPAGLITTGNPATFLNGALLLTTPGVTLTGDVTGSGSTFATTIANDAVTYAKMQNVSAADKVLGSTTGAGDVEEIACTAAGRTLIAGTDAAAQKTTLSLNLVENTALSTWAGTANVITLGTVTTGTWSATTISLAKGGTGATTMGTAQYNLGVGNPTASGDLLVGMADGRWYRLANGTTGQVLTATTASTPTWAAAAASVPTTGAFQNLIVYSNDTATVTVTADGITLNSTTSTTPMWAATVNVSASPAVTGVGGLDTGAEASSTLYSVWLVGKANAGAAPTIACLLSIQTTTPAMPTGYTHYRLVGWLRNDGSANIIRFRQQNRWMRYLISTTAILSAGVATSFTNVDITAWMPPGTTRAMMVFDCVSTGASRTLWIRPGGDAGFPTSGLDYVVTSTAVQQSTEDQVLVSAGRTFDYKVSAGALSVYIYMYGYHLDGL